MAVTRRRLLLSLVPSFVLLAACGGDSDGSPLAKPGTAGYATARASHNAAAANCHPNASADDYAGALAHANRDAFAAARLAANDAIVIGGEVRTRSQASTTSDQVGTLPDKSKVQIAQRVQGENWLVGTQTWSMVVPSWAREWFKLSDGSFVYGAFVFILQPGEVSPLEKTPDGVEKWIDVDIARQTARAMVGDRAVFTAPISSGAAPFDTPKGKFAVEPDGRIAVERMTATQAGYDAAQAQYNVERVLYTQYFDQKGNALHLNYWRPHSVFGRQATSHGCVGLELHESAVLLAVRFCRDARPDPLALDVCSGHTRLDMTNDLPGAFFTRDGDNFVPTQHAVGPWNPNSLHGRVVAGLLGRTLWLNHGDDAFHPTRLTVDMFRLPTMSPLQVRTEAVREGNRIRVADGVIVQEGAEVARARIVLLKKTDDPNDDTWRPPDWTVPSPDERWRKGPAPFANIWETRPINYTQGVAEQRRTWLRETRLLVQGEALTPFVRCAVAADLRARWPTWAVRA